MKANSLGLVTICVLSIGILFGFIAGALNLSPPFTFNVSRMIITWVIFAVISIGLGVITLLTKSQELLLEQTKQDEAFEDNPDILNADGSPIVHSSQPIPGAPINTDASITSGAQTAPGIPDSTFTETGAALPAPDSFMSDTNSQASDIQLLCQNCGFELSPSDTICPICDTPVPVY